MFYMASTKIDQHKTAAEVQALLGRKGATRVLTEYKDGEITALSFTLEERGRLIPFRIPLRWEACLKAMAKDKGTPKHLCTEAQARRTAWRLVLRWIEAQLAMVDTEMVTFMEVMLPYIQLGERTFYEQLEQEHFKMLPHLEDVTCEDQDLQNESPC